MKIIYIAPQAIPSQSANSIHMMKMAQAMAHNGHRVTLLCARGSDDNDDDIFAWYGVEQNFRLLRQYCKPGRIGLISYGFRNATTAREIKPDFVFSRCLMSAWACVMSGLPVLFEIHDSPSSLGSVARSIFRHVVKSKNFMGIVVISQALKNHLASEWNVPPEKIIVAPDGANPLPPMDQYVALEKKPGSFHAGYTGHLYKGRGIEIIAAMAKAANDTSFHIVGGTKDDVSYWQNELKGLKNLHFHGHVPPALIPGFLQHFDVLLAPYQKKVAVAGNTGDTASWMSPLKIFEYMASGKPMICSNMPVLLEVLRDNENALLRTPDSEAEWIEALTFLKINPREGERIGRTAREDFLSHYTWQKRAEKILEKVTQSAL